MVINSQATWQQHVVGRTVRKDSCDRTGSFRTRAKKAFVRSSTAMVSVAPPCMSFSRTAPTMRSSAGPTTTVYITSHHMIASALRSRNITPHAQCARTESPVSSTTKFDGSHWHTS